MVRISQFAIALVAMAFSVNAEQWCQCKYTSGAHCCVANGAESCDYICGLQTQCGGTPESISYITYLGR